MTPIHRKGAREFLLCSQSAANLLPHTTVGVRMFTHLVSRPRLAGIAAVLAVLGFAAGDASAQRPAYRERPEAYNRDFDNRDRSGRGQQPRVFDYHPPAVAGSPPFCADTGGGGGGPPSLPRPG